MFLTWIIQGNNFRDAVITGTTLLLLTVGKREWELLPIMIMLTVVPWLLCNNELDNVTSPFVSYGSITRYNNKCNQIELIRKSWESRPSKVEIKSNRVAIRILNFLVTTQPKESICTAISLQYSHLVWYTKSCMQVFFTSQPERVHIGILGLQTTGSRWGLHQTGVSKGLRSPWHVELLWWAGLGHRGTVFRWRAGLHLSSSLGHWVLMWLGYHWCWCWSPKWRWRCMFCHLLQVDSVAAVCCPIGLNFIGTVVKASSDHRLTPLLVTFSEWRHSHCILKGSEILCVLIKVFLLLLLVQLQFLSPVLDSSSGAFRW